jgi:uncharacterized protein
MRVLLLSFLLVRPALAADPAPALSESVRLHAQACDKGVASGCNNLGLAYARGRGAPRDLEKARALYRRACEAGEALGCNNLGTTLEGKERIALYEKACAMPGGALACSNLGVTLTAKDRSPKEKARGRALLEKSCADGSGDGCHSLGNLVDDPTAGTPDPRRAEQLFHRSCELGCASGCVNLGRLLERGAGAPAPDTVERMVRSYETACQRGDATGCNNLGVLYLNGKHVRRDLARAEGLLRPACDEGMQLACTNLGLTVELRATEARGKERLEQVSSPGRSARMRAP